MAMTASAVTFSPVLTVRDAEGQVTAFLVPVERARRWRALVSGSDIEDQVLLEQDILEQFQ